MMIKRICAIFVAISLICTCFINVHAENDNYKYFSQQDIRHFSNQIGFFESIGIMNSLGVDISSTITRIEFAEMITKLLKIDEAAPAFNSVNITDVSEASKKYASFTAYAGIMECDGEQFRPEESLTYDEAVYALVKALGYGALAEKDGGTPVSYAVRAQQIGIIGDNALYGDYPITLGVLLDMIENAISVELVGQSLSGTDYSVMPGQTILTEYLKAEKHRGILHGTSNSNIIRENGLGNNYVDIDGKLYKADGDYNEYLGMSVDYYLKETAGEVVLVFMNESSQNKMTVVDAENIESGTASRYVYYDGDKEKTINLAKDCLTVYNGSALTAPTSAERKPDSGYIEFIDNNGDNQCDVLRITEYSHYVAGSINTEYSTIYDKYAPSKKINLSKAEYLKIYLPTGLETNFAGISADDVLTVIENKAKNMFQIYISRQIADGAVTRIWENNGQKTYEIGGNEYTAAKDYFAGDKISVLAQGIFRLNINGQLVSFEKGKDELSFGYLINAATDGIFTKELRLKIFSAKGDMLIASMADKIKIDGKTYKEGEKAYNALLKGYATPKAQVVQYRLTDGKFTELVTAYNNNQWDEGLDPMTIAPPEGTDKSSLRVLRANGSHTSTVLRTVGGVGVGSNTVIFTVPEDAATASDEEFGIGSGFAINVDITCELYGASDTDILADVAVTYQAAKGRTEIGVVSEVEEAIDPNGTYGSKITVFCYPDTTEVIWAYNGEDKSATGLNDGKVYGIDVGDVVQYNVRGLMNKVNNIYVLCKASAEDMDRVTFTNPYGHVSYDEIRYSYGCINETVGNFFQLTFCDPADYPTGVPTDLAEVYTKSGLYFIEVDTSGRETTVSRVKEMTGKDYKNYLSDCNYAFVRLTYGYTRLMVIFK